MERHSLIDADHNGTSMDEHIDVFDDEFEVDDFDTVADGFRPTDNTTLQHPNFTPLPHAPQQHAIIAPSRSTSGRQSLRSSLLAAATLSRHSTGRSRRRMDNQDPFASPYDNAAAAAAAAAADSDDNEGRESLQFEPDVIPPNRSASSASSYVYAQTNSPRAGMSGPSHPYGMYPQGTLARSPSVTTTSTAVPSRRSMSQRAPQHPYAMYPQGVEEDMDDDLLEDHDDPDGVRQNPVQVGFPGLGLNYVRRTHPDHEDQDIIGEYGHAEQLPPYTRYPDEGPEKMPLLMPTALHSRAPVAGTDPGMPLMHTPFHPSPTPQSMTDPSERNRESITSSSGPLLGGTPGNITEKKKKNWRQKSWKERAKTRVWRVPCWSILIVFLAILLVLAFMGGMIGGFVAGRSHASSQFPTITVVTSLLDASLIATPTGVGPPTGTFALSLGPPTAVQSACLTQPSQNVAWACDLVPNDELGIVVVPPTGSNNSGARIIYAAADQRIFYGSQAWAMDTGFGQFLTVMDNDAQKNGPAFYWQQYYNKIVVVPANAFNPNTGKFRRQAPPPPSGNAPQPGDQPWFCVWNNTFLEGFIYPQQPRNTSTPSTSTKPPPVATLPTGSTTGETASSPTGSVNYDPAAIITTTYTDSHTTVTFVGPSQSVPSWLSTATFAAHLVADPQSTAVKFYGGDNQVLHESSDHAVEHDRRQDADAGSEGGIWSTLAEYPFQVKLEERRVANNPVPAYCQQYQILWNWAANWVADANGNPIKVMLDETDPSYKAYQSAGLANALDGNMRRAEVPGCHCEWVSGQLGP